MIPCNHPHSSKRFRPAVLLLLLSSLLAIRSDAFLSPLSTTVVRPTSPFPTASNDARIRTSLSESSSVPLPTTTPDDCPPGYYLDSVRASCRPLSPLGKVSQRIETFGPFQKVYQKITNLFGIDKSRISKLGVAFALSYSIISNINGSISLSVAWYMSCKKTGLSPFAPGQWKSLLACYGTIYGLIQLLRPFRVAAAIAMSKLSGEFLVLTQEKLNCSQTFAIFFQYMLGCIAWVSCAGLGILVASLLSGVPILS